MASAPPAPTRIESEPADPLVIDQRTPDTDLNSNWTFSRGGSSGPNYIRDAEEDPFYQVNPVGYYQGVSIGGGNLPPFAPTEIGGESAVLTWTGFERTESTSRVFFQLSTAVTPEIQVEGLQVVITFPRTSVKVRNNRRRLITKYFKTPVNQIDVKTKGKDVIAVLAMRWEATPQWRFEPGANGYQVLVVEFSDTSTSEDGPPPPPPHPTPTASDGDEPGPFLPPG